jgi:hypothetical protein
VPSNRVVDHLPEIRAERGEPAIGPGGPLHHLVGVLRKQRAGGIRQRTQQQQFFAFLRS